MEYLRKKTGEIIETDAPINTEGEQFEQVNKYDMQKLCNLKHVPYSPSSGESLKDYCIRLREYVKMAHNKNWNTHVDNGRKQWYTHRNPQGCFMCEDTQLHYFMLQIIEELAKKYPKFRF